MAGVEIKGYNVDASSDNAREPRNGNARSNIRVKGGGLGMGRGRSGTWPPLRPPRRPRCGLW